MKFILISLLTSLFIFSNFANAQNSDFDYIRIKGHTVKTTHQAKYKININKSFKFLGEFHHQPTYGEKQFNVSVAVYTDGENIIMIHAETHTDSSGGLDYSNLTPAKLNKLNFTTREQCATAEDEAELSANPQIRFIRDKGFDLTVPFFLQQFFTTSDDGKAEVIISYGHKIDSCDELTDNFKKTIDQGVKKNIKVLKYK